MAKELDNGLIPTNDIFTQYNKGAVIRFQELYFSTQIIRDSLNLIEKGGKNYQINVVCGQLRSLLFEKSKGVKPLFFEILDLVNKRPFIYASETNQRGEPSKLISINGLNLFYVKSSVDKIDGFKEYTLKDFLRLDVISFKQLKLPLSKLVADYSNYFGGSHYSNKTPKYLIQLINIYFNGFNVIEYVIYKQAKSIYEYIFEVIRSTIELDYFVNLKLSLNTSNNEYGILRYDLPNNPNGFKIILKSDNILQISIVDSIGKVFEFELDALPYINKHILLNIEVSINSSFEVSLKVYINNKLIKSKIVQSSFIFINELHNYNLYINKLTASKTQDYEFKIGDLFYYNQINNVGLKSDIYQHFKGLKSMKTISKNCFGQKKPHKTSINFN